MENFIKKLSAFFLFVWDSLVNIVRVIGKALLDILFRFVDLVMPLTKIAGFIRRRLPKFWEWLMGLGFIKRMISRNIFRKFGNAAPARPHAFTMAAPYTTWYGFVNRKFTGRHLPEPETAGHLPEKKDLVELFLRPKPADGPKPQTDCIRSTVLFSAFAQWFTDSFLRTDHAFEFDDNTGVVLRDENEAPIRKPGRAQKNTSNHEIDLCQIYGLNEKQTSILRTHAETGKDKGCLRYQEHEDGEYPEFLLKTPPTDPKEELDLHAHYAKLHPDERILRSIFLRADHNDQGYETIFAAGLEHSNATIGNALLNTIFLREHNRVARLIAAQNDRFSDEQVFQITRNVMIVLLLKVVLSDYIRHISPLNLPIEFQPGFAETQHWYRTNRISIEFNILYRWHGLVPDEFDFMPVPSDPHSFRHNNKWLMDTGVAKAVELFSKQRAGRITIGNTPRYLAGVKTDTINLMRDANLEKYNAYRKHLGLHEAKDFSDVTDDPDVAQKLSSLYKGNINDLEWYVGMLAESHGEDMIMGEMLLTFVAHDAFTQALTNPLLSKAAFNPKTFTNEGWGVINATTTLEDIVSRNLGAGQSTYCSFRMAE